MREFLLVLKALANPARARIIKLLEEGELCVCDIIIVIGLKQSTISKHLNILKNAGLVDDRKDGTWAYYRLSKDRINEYNVFMNTMMKKCLNEDDSVKKDKIKMITCCCCKKKE
jgi:ArsR family transcriptional regulator, arsenate/arsenite/antimonite-responsive transcriptional repressor